MLEYSHLITTTYSHQDNDPGGRVEILRVGVDQADGVHHRGEEWPHVGEVTSLQALLRMLSLELSMTVSQ